MNRFAVIDARPWHCGQMVRMLREEQLRTVAALGLDPHRALRDRFDQSPAFRRAWLIDGQLAALGGVTGSLASIDGMVWLAVTKMATRFPIAMVRTARQQLEEATLTRHDLYTTLLDGDEASRRFALALGFAPCCGEWVRAARSRVTRQALAEQIVAGHAMRLSEGRGQVTPLRFHAGRH